MKLNIYIQDNCDFCKQIEVPEGINVDFIYTNRDDYSGFIPTQLPVLQIYGVNFEGPYAINAILKIANNAKE